MNVNFLLATAIAFALVTASAATLAADDKINASVMPDAPKVTQPANAESSSPAKATTNKKAAPHSHAQEKHGTPAMVSDATVPSEQAPKPKVMHLHSRDAK
jgi:hypothetical protein